MLLGVLFMTLILRLAAVALAAVMFGTVPASAQYGATVQPAQRAVLGTPSSDGVHRESGSSYDSRGLASVIERAVSQWASLRDLGEEGSGAFVAGLRYGEGTSMKNAGDLKTHWQGPSSASTGAATVPAR